MAENDDPVNDDPAQGDLANDDPVNDDSAGAMLRLEHALERIARSARPMAAGPPAEAAVLPSGAMPAPSELAGRVDALIARLRSAIGPQEA